jgi:hypothetical protein
MKTINKIRLINLIDRCLEIIELYLTHIHRHKAASRDGQLMADSDYSFRAGK